MGAPDRTGRPSALVAWQLGPGSAEALAAARAALAADTDPMRAAAELRRRLPDLRAEQSSAALLQADLADLALRRYGIADADRLRLTRAGLEQATSPAVALRRGRLLAAAGVRRVVDLTAGLGFDAAGFIAAGLDVTAVERDPDTAAFCAHNVPAAHVIVGDATDPALVADLLADLDPSDAVFVDPARRDPAGPRRLGGTRALPERDPERWSPPWSWVAGLPHPRIAAKVSPAFARQAQWWAEWVSVERTVVECLVASWPLSSAPRAVVLPADVTIEADGATPPVLDSPPPPGMRVHEPDPAVARAGALGALAAELGLSLVSATSDWLAGPANPESARARDLLRSYTVIEVLDGSAAQQRQRLAAHGVASLTVKNRGTGEAPDHVRRRLRVREGDDAVLVVVSLPHGRLTLLTRPL